MRRRDAPLIFYIFVYGHAVFFSRKHLAPHSERKRSGILRLAHQLLELRSETRDLAQICRQHPSLRTALHSIASDKLRMTLVYVSEFWNVDSIGATVVSVVSIFGNRRYQAARTNLKDVIHQ